MPTELLTDCGLGRRQHRHFPSSDDMTNSYMTNSYMTNPTRVIGCLHKD